MSMRRKLLRSMYKAKMLKIRNQYLRSECKHVNQGFKSVCPDCGLRKPWSLYPGPYNYPKD